MIDRIVRYRTWEHANIHRGVHYLSETATAAYEHARRIAREFLNAGEDREVIFTSNCTDGINLVAHGYGRKFIGAGDEIILTHLEHHANIVPWQMLCEEKGARLRIVPVTDAGELVLDEYEQLFNARTKFVAITHVSNALGTINPVKAMIATAHGHGVPVLVDGAQAAPHLKLDVRDLDCDFYAITGHKMFGPTGIGVLYGKAPLLEAMQPFKGGGDMILSVTFEKTTYNHIPHKFEAGTPPIAEAIGLGAAMEYVKAIGHAGIAAHEHALLAYATELLGGHPRRAADRDGEGEGLGALLLRRRRPPARRRHAAQPGGRRGPHRASLRAAADAALRRPRHRAGVVRVLQHLRRSRGARRGGPQGAEDVRVMDSKQLYQEVILDHNKKPRNWGKLDDATHRSEGVNPLCGDHIWVAVKVDGERIEKIAFEGESCAICKASASMMTTAVKGKTTADAEHLVEHFRAMAVGAEDLETSGRYLGRLTVFAGVRDLPSRVKCAILPWHTLHAAFSQESSTTTEGAADPVALEAQGFPGNA